MFELAGPSEDLDLFVEDDITDIELTYFAYLDQHHHDL